MSETKACPICGKEMKEGNTACSFKCFRILNGMNKPKEKAHVMRKNTGTVKNPWNMWYLECLCFLMFLLILAIIASSLLF